MKKQINNFINGIEVMGSGSEQAVYSPLDGVVLGEYKESLKSDVDKAVADAVVAQKAWGAATTKTRVAVHYEYRNLLKRDREELATICHLENGKTMAEAYAGVDKAIELVEYATSMPALISGEAQEVSRGVECKNMRVPIGVVASITPFNFPVMVPHWTVPNALAVGNAVILKPSELTPLSALKSAALWKEAGLPDGLLQVLVGGKEAVEAICDHPNIVAVTFVGSTPVAQVVYRRSAQALKRVMTYGGAKNYMLLTETAHPKSADDIISAFCGMAGQRCMAASVVVAVGKVDTIIDAIVEKAKAIDAGCDLPPLISEVAVKKVEEYLTAAEEAGAKIVLDGRRAKLSTKQSSEKGYYIGPSIIDWKTGVSKMPLEEIFGPTLEILRVDTLDEAIALQNASPYGNGVAIFTQNGRVAQEAVGGLQAGMIGINVGIPVPREPFSFGGIKHSRFGQGDITGWSNVEFFTDMIKVTSKWNPEDKRDWMS